MAVPRVYPSLPPAARAPEQITTATTTIEMSREFHGHFGERGAELKR